MHNTIHFLSVSALVLLFTFPVFELSTTALDLISQPVLMPQEVSVASFDSIELHDGVNAILQYGPTHKVTLVKGSLDYTQIKTDGGRLIVNKCPGRCPRGYELEIHIVTPHINGISVESGGMIRSSGSFPGQSTIAVAVNNGGVIDVRSITVDTVTAAVAEGGAIYIRPQSAMTASVVNGGVITYWGNAAVTKSVQGGGAVTRGRAGDLSKPVSEFEIAVPPVPPVPVIRQE